MTAPPLARVRGLLEREDALDRLRRLSLDAVEGNGGSVAVVGPAGIGKTRLVAAGAAAASELGLATSVARGGRLERDLPFAIVRQLFAPLLRAHPDVLAAADPAAASVLGRSAQAGEGAFDQAMVLQALYWTLADLTERQPVLLVADDVHWCDLSSLRFLSFVSRRAVDLHLGLVFSTRPPEPGETADVLAALLGEQDMQRVPMPALSTDAVAALAADRFGVAPAPEFTEACVDVAGGNPFLTLELLAALELRAVPPTAEGAVAIASGAGPAAGDAILRRIGGLPPGAAELARAVAILGARADTYAASRITGLSAEQVATAADDLLRADILTADRPFAFVHPLVRQAVYDDLGPGARSLRHRRAATLLAEVGAPATDVGAHLLVTDPAGDGWVVDRLVDAAAEAAAQGAPEMGLALLLRARTEPPAVDRRLDITFEAGRLAVFACRPEARELLQEVFESAPSPERGIEAAGLLRTAMVTGVGDNAFEFGAKIYREATDPALRLQALSGLAQAAMIRDGDAASIGYFDEFMGTVSCEAEDTPAICLAVRSLGGLVSGAPASAVVAHARRALDRHAREQPGVWAPWWVHASLGLLYSGAATLELAEANVERARSLGAARDLSIAGWYRGLWHLTHGDLASAEVDARRCLDADVLSGRVFFIPGPVHLLLDILMARGDLDEADRLLRELGLDGDVGVSHFATRMLVSRGMLRGAQGRHGEAIEDLRLVGSRAAAGRKTSPAILAWRSELALALEHAGLGADAYDEARILASEELRLAEEIGVQRSVGIARRAVSLLGRDAVSMTTAAAELEASGDLLLAATALVDLGVLLRRGGGAGTAAAAGAAASGATEALRRGLDLADSIGATAVALRARSELSLAGVRPVRNRTTGVEALTPAELRTARLAATGATNRVIAQTSYLSTKTVETQLAAVYRKLGCSGRAGIAELLSGG